MKDLIERQAAIDILSLGKEILSRVLDDTDVVGVDREKYSWGLGLIESNIEDIEELPSAHPESNWIPVSERFPKNEDYVLVCYEDGHIRTAYYYIDTNFYPSEFEDCCETGWYNYNKDFMYRQDVIAWMPLPLSYQGEEGSKE